MTSMLKTFNNRLYATTLIQRYPYALGVLQYYLLCFVIFAVFRTWLFVERFEDIGGLTLSQMAEIFLMGLRMDGIVIGYTSVPLVLLLLLFPRRLSPVLRAVALVYTSAIGLLFLASEVCGIYFFRYYDFRFNYLVLDHWSDPQLLETVAQAYPIPLVLCAISGLFALFFFLLRQFSPLCCSSHHRLHSGWRDRCALLFVLLLTVVLMRGTLERRPLNPAAASITKNRLANEITGSGVFKVVYEGLQRMRSKYIPLKKVIPTLNNPEALERAQEYFAAKGTLTGDSANPLSTRVDTGRPRKNLNVVLIVMESLTAKVIGTLGGNPDATPEFNRIAEEGVLLENCYATGERTIQGLESIVCSFPPLPGVGAVRRPQAQSGFTTLGSVLKQRGYRTVFFYGGQGIFDHKIGFFLGNGYDTFLEEKDFKNPIFKTPWGASDEDLYQRANEMGRRLSEQGRPFFFTILTSSLHSPWIYPEGKIEKFNRDVSIPPGFEYEELNNYKYADYALGNYFRDARKADYFKDTVFIIIGDHGVHLRGNELIPVSEYRVGALLYAPGLLQPQRIQRPVSQMAISPTILGLLGGTYRTTFFGLDIFSNLEAAEYSIMIYDKKRYGILKGPQLTVLGDTGTNYAYHLDSESSTWQETAYSPAHAKHAATATAMLQSAEKLLIEKKYHAHAMATASRDRQAPSVDLPHPTPLL
ncbi:LTA synthase family protein [Thermodesulfobacteriota bacterium]